MEKRPSQQIMSDVYGVYWLNEKTHGPADARVSLLKRIKPELSALQTNDWVLDLGSGRQVLEGQLLRDWSNQIHAQIATIDIAALQKRQLLRRNTPNVHHARGDGAHLPYKDGTFSIVFSSMGLELMPAEAIEELARVTKPNGKVFLNVLDPSISNSKKDLVATPRRNKKNTESDRRAQEFWDHYARSNNVFNKGSDNIGNVLSEYGLEVSRLQTVGRNGSSWIEIDATRSTVPFEHKNIEMIDTNLTQHSELTSGQQQTHWVENSEIGAQVLQKTVMEFVK